MATDISRKEPENPWKEAIIDACVIGEIGWDENDARKSLRNILNWEVQIALDPLVSSDAQALIETGRKQIFDALRHPDDGNLVAQLRAASSDSAHPVIARFANRLEQIMNLEKNLAAAAAEAAAVQAANNDFPFS